MFQHSSWERAIPDRPSLFLPFLWAEMATGLAWRTFCEERGVLDLSQRGERPMQREPEAAQAHPVFRDLHAALDGFTAERLAPVPPPADAGGYRRVSLRCDEQIEIVAARWREGGQCA